MASIIFTQEDGTEIVCELVPATISFGKAEENDIFLEDEAISSYHGNFSYLSGKYIVTDLDSTNGTKINGQKITKHSLKDGDKISVGKLAGTFFIDEESRDKAQASKPAKSAPKIETSEIKVDSRSSSNLGSDDSEFDLASMRNLNEDEHEDEDEEVSSSKKPSQRSFSDNDTSQPATSKKTKSYNEESNTLFYVILLGSGALLAVLGGLSVRHYQETGGFFPTDAFEKIRYIQKDAVETEAAAVAPEAE